MRTARRMGIKTVAVFSDADRMAPHVRYADEAVNIGPASSAQSYLAADRIIDAALQTNADGVHPGYGFLSENPAFADKVISNGLTFIGPTAPAIKIMGNKLSAKKAVMKYDIPMVPGGDEAVKDVDMAVRMARVIGYPILIKASAGGGGKGMRVVHDEDKLASEMRRAQSEALSSFGDDAVFVEKIYCFTSTY